MCNASGCCRPSMPYVQLFCTSGASAGDPITMDFLLRLNNVQKESRTRMNMSASAQAIRVVRRPARLASFPRGCTHGKAVNCRYHLSCHAQRVVTHRNDSSNKGVSIRTATKSKNGGNCETDNVEIAMCAVRRGQNHVNVDWKRPCRACEALLVDLWHAASHADVNDTKTTCWSRE